MSSPIGNWSWKTWFLNAATTVTATACVAGCTTEYSSCAAIVSNDGGDATTIDSGTDAHVAPDTGSDTGADTGTDTDSATDSATDAGSDAETEDASDGATDGAVSDAPADG